MKRKINTLFPALLKKGITFSDKGKNYDLPKIRYLQLLVKNGIRQ